MNENKDRRLIILVSLILVIALIGSGFKYELDQKGKLQLSLNLPNITGTSVKINNKVMVLSGVHETYQLHEGKYSLSVMRSGYNSVATQFNLRTGQTVIISAQMQPVLRPTSVNISQLSLPGVANQNVTTTQAQYFYNQTWAVLTVEINGGDSAVVVAQYNVTSGYWQVVLGPGTAFSTQSAQPLPSLVYVFLNTNNYIETGNN